MTAVGVYFSYILNYLRANLESKAKTYDSTTLGIIFLLNNYHYVHKTLAAKSNNKLGDLVAKGTAASYGECVANQHKVYLNRWNKVVKHIDEGAKPVDLERLGKADKEAIKERFRGFNSEFESITAKHTAYSIPDPALREEVRKEVQALIMPLYGKFLDRYQNVQFTKVGIDKYLKYPKDTLDGIIVKLFDTSAV